MMRTLICDLQEVGKGGRSQCAIASSSVAGPLAQSERAVKARCKITGEQNSGQEACNLLKSL